MHYFLNLLIKYSTFFGQIYCPSLGVSTLYTKQKVFVMLVMLASASVVRMELRSSILTWLADSQQNYHDKYLLLCIQC